MTTACIAFLAVAAAGSEHLPDPASYSAIGWLVVSLSALVAAVNQIDHFASRHKSKPPAGELQVSNIALEERVQKLEESVDELRRDFRLQGERNATEAKQRGHEIYAKIDQTRVEIKTDINGLHSRITELVQSFAEVKGACLAFRQAHQSPCTPR